MPHNVNTALFPQPPLCYSVQARDFLNGVSNADVSRSPPSFPCETDRAIESRLLVFHPDSANWLAKALALGARAFTCISSPPVPVVLFLLDGADSPLIPLT